MTHADTISAYILDTQIKLFEDAKADLQISFAEMSRRAGLLTENGGPSGTLKAWATGVNALSLWGIKRPLRVKGNDGTPHVLLPYLSRLFEPEECALVGATADTDHDTHAARCIDFAAAHARARHPDSPGGIDIVDIEDRDLRARRASA